MRPTRARSATASIVTARMPDSATSARAASSIRSLAASPGGATVGSSASVRTRPAPDGSGGTREIPVEPEGHLLAAVGGRAERPPLDLVAAPSQILGPHVLQAPGYQRP